MHPVGKLVAIAMLVAVEAAAQEGFNQAQLKWLEDRALQFEIDSSRDGGVHAFARGGGGYSLLLNSNSATLTKAGANPLRMRALATNSRATVHAEDQLASKTNYLLGNNPKRWSTNVPTYGRLRCENIYRGIDLVFYGNQQQLEYDFRVAPHAQPEEIKFDFSGADQMQLTSDGDLALHTRAGEVRMRKPEAYQTRDGQRIPIAAHFVLNAKHQISFSIDEYDHAETLVIDPVVVFSNTIAGNGSNVANGIAVDATGNAYIVGTTTSTNLPTMNPYQAARAGGNDVFVMKFDPGGALLYSTYLGGTSDDIGRGIAVDSAGNVYITGWTFSSNFPTMNPYQAARSSAPDVFIAKLNTTGSGLVYSTYLGGTGDDRAYSIALDGSNNACVTGQTFSSNFPTMNPYQATRNGSGDVFVAKLNAAGSALVYSTYLGGSQSFEIGNGITADADGNAYVVGQTVSTDFPRMNPLQINKGDASTSSADAFLSKFNATGGLIFSTYLGGSSDDLAYGVAIDSARNIFITGTTSSFDFPTQSPLLTLNGNGYDAFVTKVNAAGTMLLFSTYLGGNADDKGLGIAVDQTTGIPIITGFTASPDFPLVRALQTQGGSGVFQSINGGTNWNYRNQGLSSPFGTTPTNINGLAIDPLDSSIYAATAGGVYKSNAGAFPWVVVNQNFTAYSVAVHPLISPIVFAGNFGRVSRSFDAGATWTDSTTGLPSNTVNSIAIDPTNNTVVYVGTGDSFGGGVYKSTDSGVTWSPMTGGLPNTGVNSLLIDPGNPLLLYAGVGSTSSGGVYRTTNGGTSWSTTSTGLPNKGVVALSFDPTNSATLFGASLSGIYKTTNSGGIWSPLTTTSFNPLSLVVDPTNPSVIYFGSETASGQGVFKSSDGGANWTAVGLTDTRITSLVIDPFTGALNAGCGMLSSTDPSTDMFLSAVAADGSSILFSSYLGSTARDEAHGVAVGSTCDACVAGASYSLVGPFGPNPIASSAISGGEPQARMIASISSKDPSNATVGKVGGTCGTDCPPITINGGSLTGYTDEALFTAISIRGGTPPYTITNISTLPAGLHASLGPFGNVIISGAPTQQTAATPITINVRDSKNCPGSGSVTLTINLKTVQPLQIGKELAPAPYDPFAKTVTFVVTVINTTGVSLDHVHIIDQANSGGHGPHPKVVGVMADAPNWTCDRYGIVLSCANNTNGMASGAIVHFTVVCDVSNTLPGDFFINSAAVQGGNGTNSLYIDHAGASFTLPPPQMTITHPPGVIHLDITGAAPNTAYHIQASPDPSPGSFSNLGGAVMTNANGALQFDDNSPGTRKFYRLSAP